MQIKVEITLVLHFVGLDQVLRVDQFSKREKLEEILNADDAVSRKTLVFVKLKRTADFLAS